MKPSCLRHCVATVVAMLCLEAIVQAQATDDPTPTPAPFRPGSIKLAPTPAAPQAASQDPFKAFERARQAKADQPAESDGDDIPPARLVLGAPPGAMPPAANAPQSDIRIAEAARERGGVASDAPDVRFAGDRYAPPARADQPTPDRFASPAPGIERGEPMRQPGASVNSPFASERNQPTTYQGRPGPHEIEGPQSPSLSIEKIVPDEVQIGKPAVFQIRVRNIGAVTAHDVQVSEEVPQGAQLLNTQPRATPDSRGVLTWSLGTIKAGDEATVQVELVPTAEGELGSVARVHFAAEASARTVATRPALAIEAIAPGQVMIGDELRLKIRISNPGSGVATGVILNEQIPQNVAHSEGTELEYEVGDLRPKESRELELTLKAVKPGAAVNLLTARADGKLHAENRTPLTVVAPALDVSLDGPRRRYLERQAVYTLWVSNPGTAAAEGVALSATLPDGMDFVAANNAGQYDPQTRRVEWLLEELPANQKGSVTLTMLPKEAGDQTIRIAGTARRGLNVEKEEAVAVDGVAAILFQVADVADPIEAGGETTYEIRVLNQGSKAASNVRVVALLPPEMQPIAAEGPTAHEFQPQQVRFQELPRLAPKADTVYRLKVKCTAPGDMRIRVLLTTDDIRTPITKEESTRVYADQ